jgi:hypothetical protein
MAPQEYCINVTTYNGKGTPHYGMVHKNKLAKDL